MLLEFLANSPPVIFITAPRASSGEAVAIALPLSATTAAIAFALLRWRVLAAALARTHDRAASSDRRTSEFSLIGGENFLVDEIWLAK